MTDRADEYIAAVKATAAAIGLVCEEDDERRLREAFHDGWIAGPVGLSAETRAALHREVIATLERNYPGVRWFTSEGDRP